LSRFLTLRLNVEFLSDTDLGQKCFVAFRKQNVCLNRRLKRSRLLAVEPYERDRAQPDGPHQVLRE
jgi:hypothetical protein